MRGVDNYLVRSAKSMNASETEIIRKVAIPAASPYIFGGLRISIGIAFVLLVASEMIAANSGLGFLILFFEQTFLLMPTWSDRSDEESQILFLCCSS